MDAGAGLPEATKTGSAAPHGRELGNECQAGTGESTQRIPAGPPMEKCRIHVGEERDRRDIYGHRGNSLQFLAASNGNKATRIDHLDTITGIGSESNRDELLNWTSDDLFWHA
ncbi:hypothetical protein SAY87_006184 [Trapa incisa]|uniref:Uncharacterized protein n=1 Tax=Trapa incisa TaxID=236973 RepID=A0AAN7K740_9MYRT|nr:hypothetical protein SAY87_006184 [Trapa incisa]